MDETMGEQWSDDEFYSQMPNVQFEQQCQTFPETETVVSESIEVSIHTEQHTKTSGSEEQILSDDDKANNGQSTHPAEDNSILNTQTLHEYCQTMTMNESVAPVLSKQEDLPTCPLMNKEKASHPESDSDSDDMPLSHLLKQKTLSFDSDYDDTTNDEDYEPTSSNDTDENVPVITLQKRKRKWWRKRNRPIKRETEMGTLPARKKAKEKQTNKGKSRTQNKNTKPSSPKSTIDSNINKALEASRKSSQVYNILKKHHEGRLNNLLTSNNLSKVSMPADGNCFFNAILAQLKDKTLNIGTVRSQVNQHLLANEDHYIGFLAQKYDTNATDTSSVYREKVEQLAMDGIWNLELSDVIPLAIANIYNRHIIIYSSRLANPIINIEPDLNNGTMSSDDPLVLAYLAVPSYEHYDSCEKMSILRTCETMETKKSSEINSEHPPQSSSQHDRNSDPVITPRKRATYKSPVKRKEVRKRIRNERQWKKNIRKERKNCGQSYFSPTAKKTVAAKSLKEIDCSNCRYKCTSNFTEDQRKELFDHFYNNEMTYERKRDYICRCIEVTSTEKRKQNLRSYKQNSRAYFLPLHEERIRVCKQFFLRTLAISDKLVRCTLSRKKHGTFAGEDGRGKHPPANKTGETKREYVKQHIESFPAVDSHYKRKETRRKFLAHGLSINKMYDLYLGKIKDEGKEHLQVSSYVYRDIFCKEYNISFHKPKKDLCEYCNKYQQKKETGTANEQDRIEYEQHQERRETARLEKEKDKNIAKADKSVFVATFDLQAVLYTPCSSVSKVYYKSKLNCYNLTIFSLSDKKGQCYLWDETNGQRGSSEIGTCVITHIKCLPSTIKHVILYSDCCTGQNRNQYLAAGLLHTVVAHPTVEVIEQKFLESGHTEMECDSMHSTIEHAKAGAAIYIPDHWDTPIHYARRRNPYTVVPLRFDNFYNLTEFAKEECSSFKTDIEGSRVNWMKVKVVKVSKAHPTQVHVKESFTDPEFKVIDVFKPTRGRPSIAKKPLKQKYLEKLPVSVQKKNDLLSLCDSLIIPARYREFYDALPTNKTATDHLPEPDVQEEELDSD